MGDLKSHCQMIKVNECETWHCCVDHICGSNAAELEHQQTKSSIAGVKKGQGNCYFSFVITIHVWL